MLPKRIGPSRRQTRWPWLRLAAFLALGGLTVWLIFSAWTTHHSQVRWQDRWTGQTQPHAASSIKRLVPISTHHKPLLFKLGPQFIETVRLDALKDHLAFLLRAFKGYPENLERVEDVDSAARRMESDTRP